jgi:hypothetical protein
MTRANRRQHRSRRSAGTIRGPWARYAPTKTSQRAASRTLSTSGTASPCRARARPHARPPRARRCKRRWRTDSAEPAALGTFAAVGSDRCPRSGLRTSVLPAGPGRAVTDGGPLAARIPVRWVAMTGATLRTAGPVQDHPRPLPDLSWPVAALPGRCRATRNRRPPSTRRPPISSPTAGTA